MQRIRVIQLISGLAIGDQSGGAEQIGIHLARLLDKSVFEAAIFAMRRYDSSAESMWLGRLSDEDIPVFGLNSAAGSPRRDINLSVRTLWEVVEKFRPAIITSHSERGDVINGLIRSFHPQHPCAVRVMHTDQQWQTHSRIGFILTQGFYPLVFDAEIGVSQAICAVLARRPLAIMLRRKPRLCYPGIEVSALKELEQADSRPRPSDIPAARPLIGIIGRLAPQKGHMYLLEAFPAIRQVLSAHLVVIGSGPLEQALRTQAERLGIKETVHFLGSRSDVSDILPHLDLLVSASLWEGLPTVILEAMATEVPVVATDVSGSREVVHDQETGTLVPAGDSTALARAVIALLSNPAQAKLIAANARKVPARFTVQNSIPCYEGLYHQVLAARDRIDSGEPTDHKQKG